MRPGSSVAPDASAEPHERVETPGGGASGITVTWRYPSEHHPSGIRGRWRCERSEFGAGLPVRVLDTQTLSTAAQAVQWLRIRLDVHHLQLPAHRAAALVAWTSDPRVQRLHQELEAHGLTVTVAVAHGSTSLAWRIGLADPEGLAMRTVEQAAS